MQVEDRKISDVTADPANVRRHPEKNLDSIIGSLKRFGQQKPIVIDGAGVVRAGNGTLAAAIALGWDTIKVVETELTGADAVAYAIADNRTAELAEWDDAALASTLEELQIDDADLAESTGFDEDEIAQLLVKVMADVEEEEESEDDEPGESLDAIVTVTFPVTAEQEVAFRSTVTKAKKVFGVESTGDAVAAIFKEWNGQVESDPSE